MRTLITSLEFSADGSLLFAGSADGCWELWELASGGTLVAQCHSEWHGAPRANPEDTNPSDELVGRLRAEGASFVRVYQTDGFLTTVREKTSFQRTGLLGGRTLRLETAMEELSVPGAEPGARLS